MRLYSQHKRIRFGSNEFSTNKVNKETEVAMRDIVEQKRCRVRCSGPNYNESPPRKLVFVFVWHMKEIERLLLFLNELVH